jgi:hypothetical protein
MPCTHIISTEEYVDNFTVVVRNEFTGEVRTIEVQSEYYRDAQIAALVQLFRVDGWRKATALVPEQSSEAA